MYLDQGLLVSPNVHRYLTKEIVCPYEGCPKAYPRQCDLAVRITSLSPPPPHFQAGVEKLTSPI